jgi:hypothetical protein
MFRRGYHSAGAVLGQSRRDRPAPLHISDDGLPAAMGCALRNYAACGGTKLN